MTLSTPLVRDEGEFAHLVALRREIHRHPELGFEEWRTAELIERELSAIGLTSRRVVGTGIVAVIEGAHPGYTVALRADMDALPLAERSGLPYASTVPGRMHACGHDAHTAILIGAARRLLREREQLAGRVVLLFQPAEEGPGGALPMLEAGVLEDPRVDAVAMLHVDTRLTTGTIGMTPGPVMASTDELHLTIEGRGGHGAAPHLATDTIPAAAATVLALQNIVARETDPLKSVVVTIGTIEGGYRMNIIADRVHLTGTVRALDPILRDTLETRIRRIIDGISEAYGTTAKLEYVRGYPPVINDPQLTTWFTQRCEEHETFSVVAAAPTMGGEDFSYFAQARPGLLMRLGVRNETIGATHSAHSPEFRLDEEAIPIGVSALVRFAHDVGRHGLPSR